MGHPYTTEERSFNIRHDFECLLKAGEPWGAVSALARTHWERPDEVMAALYGCPALQSDCVDIKTIGVYYSGMGTGGAEHVTRDLIGLWQSMGYRVVFLCNEGPDIVDQYTLPVDVVRVPLPTCFDVKPEDYGVRARALGDALRTYQIDLLVYGQWLSETLPWDLLLSKALGVPVVIQTHGTFGVLAGYGRPEFLKLCETYAHANAVTCLSEADRTFWLQFNPRTFYIPNPLDPAFLNAKPASLVGHRVLWVGRIAPDKNPFAMIDVLYRVRKMVPDAKLSMVGPVSQAMRAALMEKACELGIGPALSLPGNVAAVDMDKVYRDASVFVMTSRYEGYPTVLAEAEAMGVPTVMYDLPYLMLAQGDCGVIRVPMDDADSLAEAIGVLLLDEARRKDEGRKARQNLLNGFADEAVLSEEWQRVFDAVAAQDEDGFDSPFSTAWYLMWKTFRSSIVDQISILEQHVAESKAIEEREQHQRREAQAHLAQLEQELADVRGSVSFRAGRVLTAPMRKIRDLIHR